MRLKKKYIALFFGLIILLTTDNVYAKEQIPYIGTINNQVLANNNKTANNPITFYTTTSERTFSMNIHVESLYSVYQQDFVQYPYVLIYFKSTANEILAVRNGTCNDTCFNGSRIAVYKLGKTTWNNYQAYNYVLVLPVAKYKSYDWVGDWQNIPDYISDTIVFGEYYESSTMAYEFSDFVLSDNIDELSSYSESQSIISNQTSLWTNINNNMTNQFHDVIQAQEDLQNIMGNEDWLNQLEQYNMMHQGVTQVSNTPISTLITMPITFTEHLLDGFEATCQPYNLGSLYGTNLVLPCIDISSYLGSTLWGIIDMLISGIMIYNISKKCVRIFTSLTELDDHDALKDMFGGES